MFARVRPVTEQDKAYFLGKWQVTRLNKQRYILRNGLLFWGLPMLIINYFIDNGFHVERFNWIDFMIRIVVWCGGGMLWAWWMFYASEKRYKQVLEHVSHDTIC